LKEAVDFVPDLSHFGFSEREIEHAKAERPEG